MGGSSFSRDDYAARDSVRRATNAPVFAHTDAVNKGKVAAGVHASLNPKGVKLREARDSDAHPVTVPIMVMLDTTGSMADVPAMIEAALPKLMGHFLEDKASGKKYLGDGYPAIMIAAVDDYEAMAGEGALQVGQFESGMEIDQTLENLWLTRRGGGTYEESYELGIYFAARHTAHDHMDKRGRKGYLFIIGDEHAYKAVKATEVKEIIGDSLQANIPLEVAIAAAQEMYHVFFVIPNMTQHYSDAKLEAWWVEQLSQQNVLKLADPAKICELIVGAVAICEQHVGLDEIVSDGIGAGLSALVPLSKGAGGLAAYSAAGLPDLVGSTGSERL